MDSLKTSLPKIVNEALHDEDKITRSLVTTLLSEVYSSQGKSNLKQNAQRALDDHIDKIINMIMEKKNHGV